MAGHTKGFQSDVINMILHHGIAIEQALNDKDYVGLYNAIHDFLYTLRNLRIMSESAITAEECGDDFELSHTETQEDFDLAHESDLDDTPLLEQLPSFYRKADPGPN
jgi:hypothetical protein